MSSIGSIGSNYNSSTMQGVRQRPDMTKMADELFAQLDTSGQGYIQKSDLQSAFDKVSSTSSSSSSTSSTTSTVDKLFSTLDTDSSGKVSKQEFSDTLTKLQSALEQQYQSGRMQKAVEAGTTQGMGGMPPPPPPPQSGDGPSMTKDELTSSLSQISTSDSRSALMSSTLENFDKADANGDGKVSFQEAMSYQQSSSSASSSVSTGSTDSSTALSSSSSNSEANVMIQIMKLMQAYNIGSDQSQNTNLMSSLSISA